MDSVNPNTYTKREGMEALLVSAARRSSYPIGEPKVDIGIILDDEHWNAVLFAVEAMLIAQCTEDNQIAADHITQQLHTALHHIHDVVGETLRDKALEEANGDPD
jgi:hypothetical protein